MARWHRWGLAVVALTPGVAFAQTSTEEIVHSVWIATCAGLVLMMQPGFALLESGFCRAKNAVNVIMKNFTDCAIASLAYWAVGFGLMFGLSWNGMVGTSDFFPGGGNDTSLVNVLYQTFFAATAATIISGAVAERVRFMPYLVGTAIMVCVIYPIYGAWVWGGTADNPGWLRGMGFLDTAGGSAVHVIGGFTALGALVVLGPRLGRFSRTGEVREIPRTLGAAAEALHGSAMLRAAFGDGVVEHYHRAAMWEIEEQNRVVTDWEVARGFERA